MKTAEKNKNQVEVERYKAELVRISTQASSASSVGNNGNVADSTGENLLIYHHHSSSLLLFTCLIA